MERSRYESGESQEQNEEFKRGRLEIQEGEENPSLVLECENPRATAAYSFAIGEILKHNGIEVGGDDDTQLSEGENVIVLPYGVDTNQVESLVEKIHQEASKVFEKMTPKSEKEESFEEMLKNGPQKEEGQAEKFDFKT